MADDLAALREHVGKSVTATDIVTAAGIAQLAATFGIQPPAREKGEALPPGWHGPFFVPTHSPDNMREDGQPAGGFMPRIPLPIQRLRGENTSYPGTLRIGDEVKRISEIASIEIDEETKGGPVVDLVFRQTIEGPDGVAVIEDRRFLYFGNDYVLDRSIPKLPNAHDWERVIEPDPVTMFRFSAVRFNSHRIHYDRDYTVGVEGHPGLIVQGTMINFLMVEMARAGRSDVRLERFTFRIHKPIYDTGSFTLRGALTVNGAALWALDADGIPSMTADAHYRGRS